ncbi:MAG: class I SAM-dependent methyltransferase [Thaumarchaeota archaeon]|nr:class I SAM-dependent methyltransferase [Nitrososphaerota archaeon]
MPEAWDRADGYEPFVGRWSALVAPRFLLWTGAKKGGDFLDVGCGTGALSQAIVDYGARRVEGVDTSEAYLQRARVRTKGSAATASFQLGDATSLRFPDGTFDTVVSGLVLNFIPDASIAMSEMKRVAKPGGTIAAYVWDYAAQMQVIRYFWDAAADLDAARVAPLDEGRRFSICKPDALEKLFRGSALENVSTASLDQRAYFEDFEDYWTPFLGGQAPAPGYLKSLAENERNRLHDHLKSMLPIRRDGSLVLNARAWGVRGRKSADAVVEAADLPRKQEPDDISDAPAFDFGSKRRRDLISLPSSCERDAVAGS